MSILGRRDASCPAAENQLRQAHDLAARQGLDVEVLCTLEFRKEFVGLTAHEAGQVIGRLRYRGYS